jgi:hypothetical protein
MLWSSAGFASHFHCPETLPLAAHAAAHKTNEHTTTMKFRIAISFSPIFFERGNGARPSDALSWIVPEAVSGRARLSYAAVSGPSIEGRCRMLAALFLFP